MVVRLVEWWLGWKSGGLVGRVVVRLVEWWLGW